MESATPVSGADSSWSRTLCLGLRGAACGTSGAQLDPSSKLGQWVTPVQRLDDFPSPLHPTPGDFHRGEKKNPVSWPIHRLIYHHQLLGGKMTRSKKALPLVKLIAVASSP